MDVTTRDGYFPTYLGNISDTDLSMRYLVSSLARELNINIG
jgi:hypothetical protein